MQDSLASKSDFSHGLPAVVPPTGRFIVRLFLVPFLIVSAVVCFLLLVDWLVTGKRNPQDYLNKLDNENLDIRWRGAEELAQVLLRDDGLATNPRFALDLTERLQREFQNLGNMKTQASRSRPKQGEFVDSADDGFRENQLLYYLSACTGNVLVGVGAPLLGQIILDTRANDQPAVMLRRRQALWALAKLGENLKRFDRLPTERQTSILAALGHESLRHDDRGSWAKAALNYANDPGNGHLASLGIDRVFDEASRDPDPFLRELVAYALNFWEAAPAERTQIESILDRLSYDDGQGEDAAAPWSIGADNQIASHTISKSPGLRIRFNASVALARRGSDKVRPAILRQMLDEDGLGNSFTIRLEDGKEVTDEALVAATVSAALGGLAMLHETRPEKNLADFHPVLHKLEQSANKDLSAEATQTLQAIRTKKH
jgi:hypothetical protein